MQVNSNQYRKKLINANIKATKRLTKLIRELTASNLKRIELLKQER